MHKDISFQTMGTKSNQVGLEYHWKLKLNYLSYKGGLESNT